MREILHVDYKPTASFKTDFWKVHHSFVAFTWCVVELKQYMKLDNNNLSDHLADLLPNKWIHDVFSYCKITDNNSVPM